MKKKLLDNKDYLRSLQAIIAGLLVIALCVGVNFAVGNLPKTLTKLDTTQVGVHSLSQETKDSLKELEEDVDLYLVATDGNEDMTAVNMLEKMEELSDHLTFTTIDPAVSPHFLPEYVGEKAVEDNGIVVASEKRSKFIDAGEYKNSTYFMGEDYVMSAISYVTKDKLDKIYALTGHDEDNVPEQLVSTLSLDGYEVETLDLSARGAIPEDAKMVMLVAPKKDLSDEETETVLSYLEEGGRLFLITGQEAVSQGNILSIADNYGARLADGYVLEDDDANRVDGMPAYVVPSTNSNVETEILLNGVSSVILPQAHGILEKDEYRDSVTVYGFLMSSEDSYSRKDWNGSAETQKSDSDEPGPFIMGAALTEQNGDISTKVFWVPTAMFLDPDINDTTNGENYTLFLNGVDWLDDDNVSDLNTKLIATRNLKILPSQKRIGAVLLVGVIPFAFLLAGVLVWMRRRVR